jgi:hypothetical protein
MTLETGSATNLGNGESISPTHTSSTKSLQDTATPPKDFFIESAERFAKSLGNAGSISKIKHYVNKSDMYVHVFHQENLIACSKPMKKFWGDKAWKTQTEYYEISYTSLYNTYEKNDHLEEWMLRTWQRHHFLQDGGTPYELFVPLQKDDKFYNLRSWVQFLNNDRKKGLNELSVFFIDVTEIENEKDFLEKKIFFLEHFTSPYKVTSFRHKILSKENLGESELQKILEDFSGEACLEVFENNQKHIPNRILYNTEMRRLLGAKNPDVSEKWIDEEFNFLVPVKTRQVFKALALDKKIRRLPSVLLSTNTRELAIKLLNAYCIYADKEPLGILYLCSKTFFDRDEAFTERLHKIRSLHRAYSTNYHIDVEKLPPHYLINSALSEASVFSENSIPPNSPFANGTPEIAVPKLRSIEEAVDFVREHPNALLHVIRIDQPFTIEGVSDRYELFLNSPKEKLLSLSVSEFSGRLALLHIDEEICREIFYHQKQYERLVSIIYEILKLIPKSLHSLFFKLELLIQPFPKTSYLVKLKNGGFIRITMRKNLVISETNGLIGIVINVILEPEKINKDEFLKLLKNRELCHPSNETLDILGNRLQKICNFISNALGQSNTNNNELWEQAQLGNGYFLTFFQFLFIILSSWFGKFGFLNKNIVSMPTSEERKEELNKLIEIESISEKIDLLIKGSDSQNSLSRIQKVLIELLDSCQEQNEKLGLSADFSDNLSNLTLLQLKKAISTISKTEDAWKLLSAHDEKESLNAAIEDQIRKLYKLESSKHVSIFCSSKTYQNKNLESRTSRTAYVRYDGDSRIKIEPRPKSLGR